MKHATAVIGLVGIAFALTGCFNTNTNTWNETPAHQTSVQEHVLVHYMEMTPEGASGNGHDGSPMRHLTISNSYVWFENYDGYSKLIPMERVRTLNWRPNPDAPEEDEET